MLKRTPGRGTRERNAVDTALRSLGLPGLFPYLRSQAQDRTPYRVVRDKLLGLTGITVCESSVRNWTRQALSEIMDTSGERMEAVA